MQFTFVVLGNPIPKGRPRLGRGRRAFTPQRTLDYEARVREAALEAVPGGWLTDLEYEVEIKLYFENLRLPDIDNVAKGGMDGLNPKVKRKARVVVSRETPFVWADDKQVRKLTVERFIDRQNPRMEVTISQCPSTPKKSAPPRSRSRSAP